MIFLSACIQEPRNRKIAVEQSEISNTFIGKWESLKRIYPYKSYLTINNDSTFSFEYGACKASGFSNGRWKMIDSMILLNSFEIDSCLYLSHFQIDCGLLDLKDITQYHIEKTIIDCDPEYMTDYIEFKNEKLYIDNDTLKHQVKNQEFCPEIRNDFSRIVKDTTSFKAYGQ